MEKIAEGKTKEIWQTEPGIVKIVSKPIITAGDGAKKDPMKDKDKWANNTTSNVFELLNRHGIETHFIKREGETAFLAFECDMTPVEVVIRRIATGSYLKRNSKVADGTVLDELVVEFFHKDDELHDPYIVFSLDSDLCNLFTAHKPLITENCIGSIKSLATKDEREYIKEQAKQIFLIIEKAWKELGITLWDMKIEFGRHDNEIILADLIDNDSWRIRDENGQQLDKQVYRDGADMKKVRDIYEIVSDMTNQWKQ